MKTISRHLRSRGVSLLRGRPLGVLGVLLLAISVAMVALLASVSLGPRTKAFAATSENQQLSQQISIRELGTLHGRYSSATAINDLGQVVGSGFVGRSSTSSGTFHHAFLWQKGKMRDLGTLGGDESEAYGINDLGQVVGSSYTASGREYAFLWRKGKMRDLGTLPGDDQSSASDINKAGQVVGNSYTAPGGRRHAVLWNTVWWTQ